MNSDLDAVHWFNPLIQLKHPDPIFKELRLELKRKEQMLAASCLLANGYLFSLKGHAHYIAISKRPENYTRSRYRQGGVGYGNH